MNARHFLRMSVVALMLFPLSLLAQRPTPGNVLPDLVPAGLRLNKDCKVVVLIRNNGPGIVPDSAYIHGTFPNVSAVQMVADGNPYGWVQLGALDPSHLTQPVGGMVIYTWLADALPPGTHVFQIDVDSNNFIAESNEGNNSLTQTLTCQAPLPDLQPIDLTLDADCRIDVTFRNNGPAAVPESGYTHPGGGNLQMWNDGAAWGGIVLGAADPVPHLSQPVGGTKIYKWFSGLPVPTGSHTVKLDMDNNNNIAEANEANNSLTKTLTCQKGPDLVPTDITLEQTGPSVTSPCRVLVTLKNAGTGIVPDAAYAHVPQAPTIQMWKGGAGFGGAILVLIDPQKVLQPAGATLVHPWMMGAAMLVPAGQHTLQVDVDNNNALVEINEANNSLTKQLTCGVVIQPPLP